MQRQTIKERRVSYQNMAQSILISVAFFLTYTVHTVGVRKINSVQLIAQEGLRQFGDRDRAGARATYVPSTVVKHKKDRGSLVIVTELERELRYV